MKIFNEFGTPPDYLNDQYRVENNFGMAESLGEPDILRADESKRQMVKSNFLNELPINQVDIGQYVKLPKAEVEVSIKTQPWWKSYYGGWKLYTLVPLAGILYYMRNADEKTAMRAGKAILASSVYAPYLIYVGGKFVYDKMKK